MGKSKKGNDYGYEGFESFVWILGLIVLTIGLLSGIIGMIMGNFAIGLIVIPSAVLFYVLTRICADVLRNIRRTEENTRMMAEALNKIVSRQEIGE